jgi:polyhydroxybutyrate depolymerase
MFGWWVRRARRRRRWFEPGEGRAVGAETLARDWAEANGCNDDPGSEPVAGLSGALDVRRLTWSAPGASPVVVYRIEGGGHGWPGGPQYLPSRVIGPVARHLDATALVLAAATHAR